MRELQENTLLSYFKRIGYCGSRALTIENLNELHERHVFSIPFEGINAYTNAPVKLDFESIFKKLILKNRGGYCYEMNGLFYSALTYLGFDVKLHLAEVVYNGAAFRSRPPRHAILLVKINDNEYLVDVGYGRNGLIRPLLLNANCRQEVYSSAFQLTYNERDGYVYKFKINDNFLPEYRFDYPQKNLSITDLLPHNHWALTSPESSFVQHAIITMPTKSGRISLIDKDIRSINGNKVEKKNITSLTMYLIKLEKEFNITLSNNCIKYITDKLKFNPIAEDIEDTNVNLSFS